MTSDNYEIQNILHYSRKSYKNNQNGTSLEAYSSGRREDIDQEFPDSAKNYRIRGETAGCSCNVDTDGEIVNILHKKCPVIALAQQQLQRILDETDRLLCDNTRCCRSANDFLIFFKELLWNENKCQCAIIIIIMLAFVIGLLIGAAFCGTNLRTFNSPILTCIDNFFIPNTVAALDDSFRAVV